MNHRDMHTLIGKVVSLIILVIMMAGAYGWVNNIILLMHTELMPVTTALVLRVIGIFFFPIGIIMGYC